MNIYKVFVYSILLFPIAGCTEQADNSTKQKPPIATQPAVIATDKSQNINLQTNRKTTILQSGDILVLFETAKGKPTATYLSTRPADKAILAQRILEILNKSRTNKSFLEFVEENILDNRELTQDNFTLPLIDLDGTEYRFVYSSDIEYGLYSINYEFIAATKN